MVNSSLEESNDNGSAETRGSAKSGSSRPSFTDYWRRTKEAARSITFVSSGPEAQAGPSKDDGHHGNNNGRESDLGKSKARRAQVRKAQIQHRERKANYTKQLEMDVVRLRDLIEQTEHQSSALRTENEAIRHRLSLGSASALGMIPSLGFSLSQPEYTASLLASSESLSTPLYQVQRIPTPSSSSSPHSAGGGDFVDVAGIPGMVLGMTMSQEQVDHAINFILELEHICWNHFHPSYYDHNDYDPEGKENGHMLMASALALRSAPAGAWEQIGAEKERRKQANPNAGSCTGTGPSYAPGFPNPTSSNDENCLNPNINTTLTSWQIPPRPNNNHTQTHTHTHNPQTFPPSPTTNPPNPSTTEPALTLESLFHLASTLNPASGPELAPVQAWFEVARLYGGGVVLNVGLMDRVKAALAPSVECLHFGAVMSRGAFEEAVERVLGPIPGPAI
ncbi:uncharacterized protein GGS22DRAFT_150834 [Annulohypoxylon maeteangense]|uniref:uncharacterized protein n=1 Tax=Annulohypoxylon maeteangense TaxID=1927788 RepID=UPI0020073DF7|nr:uncharacterized protein GGS22DRAFT_150834 [Annulohypoxylon maeteangense]KAI0890411.1 hypothetical protein GGS22DRAFT_150834 [Annulohypoxylon maeteangense]